MSTLSTASEGHNTIDVAQDIQVPARQTRWLQGALIGGLAALIASGIMLWTGRAWGGAILAQLMSERIIDLTPLSVFSRILAALESNAKPLTLLGLTLVQTFAGAGIGAFYARRVAGTDVLRRLTGGLVLSLLVWLFLSIVAAPLGSVGLFARDAQNAGATQATFVLAALSFGAIVATFLPWPFLRNATTAPEASRRRLIQLAGISVLALPALVATGYIGRYVQQLRTTFSPELATVTEDGPGEFDFAGMPEEITPTDAFYVVSKNFVDPEVDSSGWALEVGGLVEQPFSLSYTDLIARDSVEFTATLECISNDVGGPYISNAVWRGFPLSELLNDAGLQDGIVDLEMHAADGYVESMPIEKALDDVMLVHTMNGEPLTYGHGYPARLIVPGILGMKNVKWVTLLIAVNQDIQGYWQERGWSDIATMLTMSRIDTPKKGYKATLGETVQIGGVAFGGELGISRVEISLDDGATWHDARLSDPLSDLSWRLWSHDYLADQPGTRKMVIRATNGEGVLQEIAEQPPLPAGSTGYHRESFEVVG